MESNAPKLNILYAEDDFNLAYVTIDNLKRKGYDVTHAIDGEMAMKLYRENAFNLCILDVMLPKVDGFVIAQNIRRENKDIPILFLTAKVLLEDKLMGFKLGGDDFLTKPFSIDELMFKIEIFSKRSKILNHTVGNQSTGIYTIGKFTFDFNQLLLHYEKESIYLTLREGELLQCLVLNKNTVVKRQDIIANFWGGYENHSTRSLDVFMSRLRKYLIRDKEIEIETIRSLGFKLVISEE